MHAIYDLKDMLCEELEEYGDKQKMDIGDLEIVDKLAHAIKNIDKIIMAKEYGLSGMDGMDDHMSGYRGQKRDSMGRYSRGRGRYSRRGRSYEGYSEADHRELVEELRDIMDHADVTMKKEFEHFIDKIEQM
jgi:hypothetical protein